MILPKRKDVQIEIQAQRKSQIDEGVILAGKIDTLRRTLGDLESQHKVLLESLTNEAKSKSLALSKEIESKQDEVKILEENRKKLLEPLDQAWKEVRVKEEDLSEKTDKIRVFRQNLTEDKKELGNKLKKARDILKDISEKSSQANDFFNKAYDLKLKTEATNNSILNEKEKQSKEFEAKNSNLEKVEARNEFDRQANENLKKILDTKEIKLNNRERAINDKYQTLLRSQTKYGKR